jgi:hypothetical protein
MALLAGIPSADTVLSHGYFADARGAIQRNGKSDNRTGISRRGAPGRRGQR